MQRKAATRCKPAQGGTSWKPLKKRRKPECTEDLQIPAKGCKSGCPLVRDQEVEGSNPSAPTKFLIDLQTLTHCNQGPNRVCRGPCSDPDVALRWSLPPCFDRLGVRRLRRGPATLTRRSDENRTCTGSGPWAFIFRCPPLHDRLSGLTSESSVCASKKAHAVRHLSNPACSCRLRDRQRRTGRRSSELTR